GRQVDGGGSHRAPPLRGVLERQGWLEARGVSMARREAILEGTQAAQRLHAQLRTKEAFERTGSSRIDVFQAAGTLGALLLFRPLSGLLGAYLGKPNFPMSGILVSTQRDLHVQRFTAAHEVGHCFMGHTVTSLDDQIGLWRGEVKDLQEVAAD